MIDMFREFRTGNPPREHYEERVRLMFEEWRSLGYMIEDPPGWEHLAGYHYAKKVRTRDGHFNGMGYNDGGLTEADNTAAKRSGPPDSGVERESQFWCPGGLGAGEGVGFVNRNICCRIPPENPPTPVFCYHRIGIDQDVVDLGWRRLIRLGCLRRCRAIGSRGDERHPGVEHVSQHKGFKWQNAKS